LATILNQPHVILQQYMNEMKHAYIYIEPWPVKVLCPVHYFCERYKFSVNVVS